MSLSKPHPLFTSAGSSPAMVSMACVQARMLSGRYRCESLLRHWKKSGSSGTCFLSSSCNEIEDVCHILQRCVALGPTRIKLVTFTYNMMDSLPIHTKALVQKYCNLSSPFLCQFLLDCSSLPDVISTSQEHGNDVLLHLFRVARTWVYSLHRERLKLRDRWRAVHDWHKNWWKTTVTALNILPYVYSTCQYWRNWLTYFNVAVKTWKPFYVLPFDRIIN